MQLHKAQFSILSIHTEFLFAEQGIEFGARLDDVGGVGRGRSAEGGGNGFVGPFLDVVVRIFPAVDVALDCVALIANYEAFAVCQFISFRR